MVVGMIVALLTPMDYDAELVGYTFGGALVALGLTRLCEHWVIRRARRKAGQPDGAANRSQPVGPEPNRTSPAAGSGG